MASKHCVRAEFDSVDPVGVFLDFADERAVLGRVDADHLAGTAERDRCWSAEMSAARTASCLVADFDDLLAGLHVPNDDLTRLPAAPAAGEQQPAIAAEFEHMRRAVIERQYAEQLKRVAVVEQHLLLPANSDQRRPRAGGQSDHRVGLCSA